MMRKKIDIYWASYSILVWCVVSVCVLSVFKSSSSSTLRIFVVPLPTLTIPHHHHRQLALSLFLSICLELNSFAIHEHLCFL